MLISGFDALLSDLDGVVYAGNGAIPKAIEALNGLSEHSVALAYVTNNASRSPKAVAAHLSELGAPASAGQVFGSADAGAELLAQKLPRGSKVLVVGSAYLRDCVTAYGMELVSSHLDGPQGVIQGIRPFDRLEGPGRGRLRDQPRSRLGGHQHRSNHSTGRGHRPRERNARCRRAGRNHRQAIRGRQTRTAAFPARGRKLRGNTPPRGGRQARHRHPGRKQRRLQHRTGAHRRRHRGHGAWPRGRPNARTS